MAIVITKLKANQWANGSGTVVERKHEIANFLFDTQTNALSLTDTSIRSTFACIAGQREISFVFILSRCCHLSAVNAEQHQCGQDSWAHGHSHIRMHIIIFINLVLLVHRRRGWPRYAAFMQFSWQFILSIPLRMTSEWHSTLFGCRFVFV